MWYLWKIQALNRQLTEQAAIIHRNEGVLAVLQDFTQSHACTRKIVQLQDSITRDKEQLETLMAELDTFIREQEG